MIKRDRLIQCGIHTLRPQRLCLEISQTKTPPSQIMQKGSMPGLQETTPASSTQYLISAEFSTNHPRLLISSRSSYIHSHKKFLLIFQQE